MTELCGERNFATWSATRKFSYVWAFESTFVGACDEGADDADCSQSFVVYAMGSNTVTQTTLDTCVLRAGHAMGGIRRQLTASTPLSKTMYSEADAVVRNTEVCLKRSRVVKFACCPLTGLRR